MMGFEIVDAEFVADNLGKLPLLDVRPTDMYAESRIPGAVSVSLMEAKEADGDTAKVFTERVLDKGFKPEEPLIVYCYNGGLAREACGLLESEGFENLLCYEGSWVDWITDSTRPIEK